MHGLFAPEKPKGVGEPEPPVLTQVLQVGEKPPPVSAVLAGVGVDDLLQLVAMALGVEHLLVEIRERHHEVRERRHERQALPRVDARIAQVRKERVRRELAGAFVDPLKDALHGSSVRQATRRFDSVARYTVTRRLGSRSETYVCMPAPQDSGRRANESSARR